MTLKDISTINRALGAIEGVAVSLPEGQSTLIFDYLEVIDGILEKEEEALVERSERE